MNKNLFKKFEEKKILEESSFKILGGGPTWPGNDYSAETGGDVDSTGNGTDCGDNKNGGTDAFTDSVPTNTNSDGPEPSTGVGLFPRP